MLRRTRNSRQFQFGPETAEEALSAADAARDDRRWQEAANFYSKYLWLRSDDAPIWVQLGHASKESGDLEGAETAYKRSLEMAPDVADTHLQLGHLYKKMRRFPDAIHAYREAVRLDDALSDAHRELAAFGDGSAANNPLTSYVWRTALHRNSVFNLFEDALVPFLFRQVSALVSASGRRLFFIEVGANDGVSSSKTINLIQDCGWAGLAIEPVPHTFAQLQQNYSRFPEVKTLNLAISDNPGIVPFYQVLKGGDVWYPMLSSLDRDLIVQQKSMIPDIEDHIEEIKVQAKTLR